jgi:hypothetical protein
MEVENGNEDDDDYGGADEYDYGGGDDDSCWRVRREALRLVETLVFYHDAVESVNKNMIAPDDIKKSLIVRLREHNENVREQAIQVISVVLDCITVVDRDQDVHEDSDFLLSVQMKRMKSTVSIQVNEFILHILVEAARIFT